tara:strand:- start:149 stop:1216 length:1068 start_codon:yes stop_codon:yes gene_type:complete
MNYKNYLAKEVKIQNFKISKNSKTFIVAEISANHGGKIKNVFRSIDYLKKIGVNAVKIQSYEADTLTLNSKSKRFFINDKSIWKGKYLYDLYKSAQTPFSWHKRIFNYSKKKGIICFSSPFDKNSVNILEKLKCPAYKIASPEIQDLDLIGYIAKKRKPIIISTGIADIDDIELALKECKKNKNNKIILLNCISSYPARRHELNLNYINLLKNYTDLVGYSDHFIGDEASLISVGIGAKVIEKHFILNKNIKSPDRIFSMDRNEFRLFVKKIRETELALGTTKVNKKVLLRNKLKTITRSLFYLKDLKKNEKITKKNIKSFRPGIGISPNQINLILGKKLKKNVKKHSPVQKKHV